MNTALLISSLAAVTVALGHSILGEIRVLRPLYGHQAAGAVLSIAGMRRLLRVIWHLPAFVWGLTGVFTYGFAYHATTPPTWFVIYAILIYGAGVVGVSWGTRTLHVTSLLLAVAAVALAAGASTPS